MFITMFLKYFKIENNMEMIQQIMAQLLSGIFIAMSNSVYKRVCISMQNVYAIMEFARKKKITAVM